MRPPRRGRGAAQRPGRSASTPTATRASRPGGRVRARARGQLPGGLGRTRCRRSRPDDAHGHARVGRQGAERDRRRRCPELVGGSADLAASTNTTIKGGGDVRPGDYARPQPPLRHPRARHGLDPATASSCHGGFARFGATFLDLLRLHAAGRAARRAHRLPVDLRLDARLGLARRGRPDAPAGRAPDGAARDPEPRVLRPGDANETVAGLARRARAHATARPASCSRARKLPTLDRARARARRGRAARRLRPGRHATARPT